VSAGRSLRQIAIVVRKELRDSLRETRGLCGDFIDARPTCQPQSEQRHPAHPAYSDAAAREISA